MYWRYWIIFAVTLALMAGCTPYPPFPLVFEPHERR